METASREAAELTYPLRAAARLTGLSPELLRAWERRYGVVQPIRTPGGTRRYSAADIERLRLLKAAVDAGNRISEVAQLAPAELRRRSAGPENLEDGRLEAILTALAALDGTECQRLLSLHFLALGPSRFARDLAHPLVHEIGERWAAGEIGIAVEHLATGILRSLLGSALQPTAASLRGPGIVFATPSGERHELGLLMAALVALGAGANPLYLGVDLPVEDLLGAAERSDAAVLALSIVSGPIAQTRRIVSALRGGLAEDTHLWLGGTAARQIEASPGVECIHTLDELERRVALLGCEQRGA